MVRCSVLGCKSDSEMKLPDLSFHSFPINDLRERWIEATGKKNWTAKNSSRICSRHFEQNVLHKKKKLTNAVPQLELNEIHFCEDYAIAEIVPDHVLENIFSYLYLKDLKNCSLVCKSWYRILNDENNDVWRLHCFKRLAEEVMKSDLLSTVTTYKSKLRAFFHAWNPHDCSRNIYVKPNGFTLHRNPVAQSTDACRSKIGFHQGRHAWEVIWEGPLGTVAVIGISTRDAPLQCQGYVGLLGSNEQSWGWNLVDNHLLHNGDTQGHYPLLNNCPKYQVGERIRAILDCEDNTLSFERNYEFLGVAFRGLPTKKLYPTVSAVYGNTEVSIVYLGPPVDG